MSHFISHLPYLLAHWKTLQYSLLHHRTAPRYTSIWCLLPPSTKPALNETHHWLHCYPPNLSMKVWSILPVMNQLWWYHTLQICSHSLWFLSCLCELLSFYLSSSLLLGTLSGCSLFFLPRWLTHQWEHWFQSGSVMTSDLQSASDIFLGCKPLSKHLTFNRPNSIWKPNT